MVGILGYDYDAFHAHMQSTFIKGMSWEMFLAGAIHIDHILPLASFDPTSLEEIRKAWALSNLRAAWPADNLAKLKMDHAVIARRRDQTPRGSGTLLAA